MSTSGAALTILFAACLLGGCSKKPAEATPAATSESTTTAATPPTAAASAAAATTPPPSSDSPWGGLSGDTLAKQLSIEAKARKPGHPSVEDVFALCEKLGAPVPSKEQTIGKTYRASYCVGGFTTDKAISINVCEYPDEAAVATGAAISTKLFKALADRRHVLTHQSTTLTVFEANPSPATQAMSKKLADAFAAM